MVKKKNTHQEEGEELKTEERKGLLLFAWYITDRVFKVRMRGPYGAFPWLIVVFFLHVFFLVTSETR